MKLISNINTDLQILEEEIWLDVVGYEGLYQISSHGRVRSLDKTVYYRDGRIRKCKGRLLNPSRTTPKKNKKKTDSYCEVCLCIEKNKRKNHLVHRLVATAFIPNPENKPTVKHVDRIKGNNRVENLEWATYSEQEYHAHKIGLKSDKKAVDMIDIFTGEILNTYDSMHEADRQTGISYRNIHLVCAGKRKQAGGYLWQYHSN